MRLHMNTCINEMLHLNSTEINSICGNCFKEFWYILKKKIIMVIFLPTLTLAMI